MFVSVHETGVPFHYFACGCPVFQAPFIEERILWPLFFFWWGGLHCQILVDDICMSLFLGSRLCSTGLCFCFYSNTILLRYVMDVLCIMYIIF